MAADTTMFDHLITQSEQLVAQHNQSYPQVQRSLAQIEAMSGQLRNRAARLDRTEESLAAATLLATTGTDAARLDRAVDNLRVRAAADELATDEACSLEDYVEAVRRRVVAGAISRANAAVVADFDAALNAAMERDASDERSGLLQTLAPHALLGASGASAVGLGPRSPRRSGSPMAGWRAATPTRTGGRVGPEGLGGVSGKASSAAGAAPVLGAYEKTCADIVARLCASKPMGQPLDATAEFARASRAALGGDDGAAGCNIGAIWGALSTVLAPARGAPHGRHGQHTSALLAGARNYLTAGYEVHVMDVIRSNRLDAWLGARPSKLRKIEAFLRVKLKHLPNALDINPSGSGMGAFNTAFHQIYYCLRCGYVEEAAEAAGAAQATPLMKMSPTELQCAIRDWSAGRLSPTYVAQLEEHARALLALPRDSDRHQLQAVVAVHVLLSGSKPLADAMMTAMPDAFETIEDFLWFRLSLVRPPADAAPAPFGSLGGAAETGYTLAALQGELLQFPDTHYTQNGKEPLRYVMVLVLSLQIGRAIEYLWRLAPSAGAGGAASPQAEAAHMCIAAAAAGVLTPTDARAAGDIVHAYGRAFVRPHGMPETALQYYMLSADISADGDHGRELELKGALLRELLVESKAFGFLNAGGGAAAQDGLLARFVPDAREREQLIASAAFQCHMAAQLDEAVELYEAARQPAAALAILNGIISDRIERAYEARALPSSDGVLGGRMRAGAAAAEQLLHTAEAAVLEERDAFLALGLIKDLVELHLSGATGRALAVVERLSFVPLEPHRVEPCVRAAEGLHPVVKDRLRVVIPCTAEILHAEGQRRELECLASFTSAFQFSLPQGVYERVSRLNHAAA